jgi:hypothetical protein
MRRLTLPATLVRKTEAERAVEPDVERALLDLRRHRQAVMATARPGCDPPYGGSGASHGILEEHLDPPMEGFRAATALAFAQHSRRTRQPSCKPVRARSHRRFCQSRFRRQAEHLAFTTSKLNARTAS